MKQLPTNNNRYFLRASIHILVALMTLSLASCASNSKKDEKEEAVPIMQEDYPTLATVEYVIECMNRKGRQNYTNLYQCTCQFDRFAEQMSYDEYSEAVVFRNLKSMPGEKGAVFRDPPQAKVMRKKLSDAQNQAQVQCEVTSAK
ncbi:MAG: hypothetical protein V3V22_04070 [Methylococcales bacterium]